MATYIKTEADKKISYEIEPDEKQVMTKNDNYLPEEAEKEITDAYKEYVENYVSKYITDSPTEGVIDIDHMIYTKNFGGAGFPIVSSPTDGNRVGFASAASINVLNMSVQNGTAGSAFTTRAISLGGSDKRLKDNIKPCTKSGLELINKLDVVQFDWKDNYKHWNYGIVAQDAKKIDDNIVIGKETDNSYLGIDTLYMIDILVKAVQELSAEIDKLKEVK